MSRLRQHVIDAYDRAFGPAKAPLYYAAAPGRVNLLGEHTDYNDGFVLPMAVTQEVDIVAAPRGDEEVHVYSLNFGQRERLCLDHLAAPAQHGWANYIRGVLLVLQQAGYRPVGMNMVVYGDVPLGAGLSSSAALEIATLLAASAVAGWSVDPVHAARLAQRAENEVVGVNCGIMDQFAARLGRQDAALLLDCRSLAYEIVPFGDPTVRVVIVNSNKKRGLVDSAYNDRRRECEEAARLFGVPALRDVTPERFAREAHRLPGVVRRRAQHVVDENARVLDAVAHLKAGDLAAFGQAMWASHVSLRDLFEVSCAELDALVAIARTVDGVLGSRMTGAGFGGCTVTLVRADALEALVATIKAEYPKQTGLAPDIYVLSLEGSGAFVATLA